MKSLWNDQEAANYLGDVPQRVYTSRLLGREPALVMHGGGNTSVKSHVTNLFGEREDVLFVKGSGWDLETIEAPGFAPCRMEHLLRLAQLEALSDPEMAAELRKSLTDVNAPSPSVEAILHAILPARFVDHTHADALLTITNTPGGDERVREIYGDHLVVIPYVMPGFKLARLCAQEYPKQVGPQTVGMLLMNHGLFTFGDTAKIAYERMIELVTRAEQYLETHGAGSTISLGGQDFSAAPKMPTANDSNTRNQICALRHAVSKAAGQPMILSVHTDPDTLAFARRDDVNAVSQQGPATPDHVIRTKRCPLVGRDMDAYVSAYREYFIEHGNASLTMLDPAPRVILDRQRSSGMAEVLSGLAAGDLIVTEGVQSVRPGQPVRVGGPSPAGGADALQLRPRG